MKKILTMLSLFIALSTFAQNYKVPQVTLVAEKQGAINPLLLQRVAIDTLLWSSQDQPVLYRIIDPDTALHPADTAGYLAGTDQLLASSEILGPGNPGSITAEDDQIFVNKTKVKVVGAKFTFGVVDFSSGDSTSAVILKLYKLDGYFLNSQTAVEPGPGTLVNTDTVPIYRLRTLHYGVDNILSGAQTVYWNTPLTVDADSGYVLGLDITGLNPIDTVGLFTSQEGEPPIVERSLVEFTFNNDPPTWNSFLDPLNGWDANVDLAMFPILDYTLYDTVNTGVCKNSTYNGQLITQAIIFNDTLVNGSSIGYDSIVTLNISILLPDTASAQVSGYTITADQTGVQYEWINCGTDQVVSGDFGQIFIAPEPGGYRLIVSNNGCADTSICYAVATGITEVQDLDFSMQPNPAKDICTIYPGSIKGGSWSATIYDLRGQLVRNLFTNEQSVQSYGFSTEMLSAGLYLLKVTDASGASGIKKLVVE